MMPFKPSSRPERSGTAPLARPFLRALTRMQDRTVPRPDELTVRASSLLGETFGLEPAPTEAAFSHGVLGLMSEHTHYFNGFALLMPVAHGSAVAVRTASHGECRCVIEGGEPAVLRTSDADPRRSVLARLSALVCPPNGGLEVAVASSIPDWWWEVDLTALGVAAARAMQALFARTDESLSLMEVVRSSIAAALDQPFSLAYPVAAMDARPGSPVLVDTEVREHLILGGVEPEEVGWGAVHVDASTKDVREQVNRAMHRAEEAIRILQRHGFPHLTSYRELEHRDLERALDALPATHAPVVKYLVTENRRVQKLVAAVRRRDWQMLGALMLMSHAVQRDDWKMTSPEADHVVTQVEEMSLEGLYGARYSGRSGTVLIAGQPYVIPNFLDRVQSEIRDRFGATAEAVLL